MENHKKGTKLEVRYENVAVPEVVPEDYVEEIEDTEDDDIRYDNVAIPEVHLGNHPHKTK